MRLRSLRLAFGALSLLLACMPTLARADVVTDWNQRACDLVGTKLFPSEAHRILAITQVAVFEAVNAITRQYPKGRLDLEVPRGSSWEAAVANVNRVVLTQFLTAQHDEVEAAWREATRDIPEGPARAQGEAIGEQAARQVIALAAAADTRGEESYRPRTTPGTYVPTTVPFATTLPQRKPWLLSDAGQFRPGPPPDLHGALWARDYNESKAYGALESTVRTPDQTAAAKFWSAVHPGIFYPIAREVALRPNGTPTRSARLLATVAQSMDDADIAVFEAKNHYEFWRPITAIRNGDQDDNPATERDPGWKPLLFTPLHQEYPCAHCAIAAAMAGALRVELGRDACPPLSSTSPTTGIPERRWSSLDAFVSEVDDARINGGIHFRNTTEVATRLGRDVGEWDARKMMQ